MTIIEITARQNGSRPPLQLWSGRTPPEGYAVVPMGLDTKVFTEYRGFVNIEMDGNVLTTMTGNQDALDAYLADHPDVPEATENPTEEEDLAAMAIDHEYRLTLLELGLSE